MQNICVRFIFNIRKYEHISNYYIKLGWCDLSKRRKLHLGCLLYKIHLNNSPPYLVNLLTSTNQIHSHNTRSRLYIPDTHNASGRKMFKFHAPSFWNNIPEDIKNSPSISIFKSLLYKHLNKL